MRYRNNAFFDNDEADYVLLTGQAPEASLDADPLLVDYQADGTGDYHLERSSPCIDAGAAEGAPVDDMDGAPRPAGGAFDIGPYEWGSPASASASSTSAASGAGGGGGGSGTGGGAAAGGASSFSTGNDDDGNVQGGCSCRCAETARSPSRIGAIRARPAEHAGRATSAPPSRCHPVRGRQPCSKTRLEERSP